MNAFNTWLDRHMMPIFAQIGSQRHFSAIRRGFLLIIPIILVGSLFMLIPGIYGLDKIMAPYADKFNFASNCTFGLIAIYLCFALAHNLAASYKLDAVMTALVAVICFFVGSIEFKSIDGTNYIPLTWIGTYGMFGAILIAVYTVELFRFLYGRGIYFKAPPGVPEGVGRFLQAILPTFITVLPIWLMSWLGFKPTQLLVIISQPLFSLADTYWAFLIALFIEHLTWYVGVHSWAAIGPAYFPFLISNGTANAEAYSKGLPLPYIATISTYFAGNAGGTGSHFMLAVFGCFSKSKTLKAVGRAGIVPSLFGINEPILFGYPVILNPIYFIPMCILAPLMRSLVYLIVAAGLVARSHVPFIAFVPPGFIWFMSNFDWRVWPYYILIAFVLSGICYYPFFRVHEKMVIEEETKRDAAEREAAGALKPAPAN